MPELSPCLATRWEAVGPREAGFLAEPLPALGDAEGAGVPPGLPPVVDAHVHLFDAGLSAAIWRWFERYGWPIRYKLRALDVVDFLLARGVEHVVALHYAHKPGIAEAMNQHMAELCRARPRVTGLATVYPGEPDARGILERGFDAGLAGVKLHCHVQGLAPDAAEMHDVYAVCQERDLPLVMHAGREPRSPGYRVDPHTLCDVARVERVLVDHPRLRLCIPHLGADEFDAYAELLERHDHLWLDTTMVMAGYFPVADRYDIVARRPERMLYGTDFPFLPYAWDRELRRLAHALGPEALEAVLGASAKALYTIG
ncbi:MAG: amidohydrolase family protein [Polyangiaceae bacterium]